MKKILLAILPLLAAGYSYAQNINYGNETFSYNGFNVYHYGLGWYQDPATVNAGPMAYLSAFGGIKFFTTGGPKAVLDVNGYLGIGTMFPNAPIHIVRTTSPNTNMVMQQWDPSVNGYLLALSNYNSSSGIDYRFTQYHAGAAYQVLTFQAGKVGIGTVNPDAQLAVKGTIHATEVLVDQNFSTPDYVFDKDYDLASLKDVKTYIDKNHHLPEIPSAAEVAKDGINLGEMNAKLLKKIEELTLYLIEKDQELNKQDLNNRNQQDQIDLLKKQLITLSATVQKLSQ